MLCMSKTSKMVFAAFMQHCNVTHVNDVEGVKGVKYYVLYSVYSCLLALPGGKAI